MKAYEQKLSLGLLRTSEMLQIIYKPKVRAFSFLLHACMQASMYTHTIHSVFLLFSKPHALFYSYGDLPSSQYSPCRLDEFSRRWGRLFFVQG